MLSRLIGISGCFFPGSKKTKKSKDAKPPKKPKQPKDK